MATVERVTAQGAGASGRRLGRYHLAEPLGAGPTGEVFRAKVYGISGFEREFAVKRFHAALVADADRAGLLARVARVYGALQHPRIARLHEFGVANEGVFAATELVRGLHIRQLIQMAGLRGAALLPGASAALLAAAARALGFAHSRGLTHLGVCPTNILCTVDGDVKVTDFGYLALRLPARPAEDADLLPRIPYLAPEQLRGEGGTPATDVFQLGLVACELLTGQAPLAGVDPREVQRRALAGELPVVTLDLPRALAQVIRRALSLAPIERFADAGALADALDAAARSVPLAGDRRDVAALVRAAAEPAPPEADGAAEVAMMAAHSMMTSAARPNPTGRHTARHWPVPGRDGSEARAVGPEAARAHAPQPGFQEGQMGLQPDAPRPPVLPRRPESSDEPTGVRGDDEGPNGARPGGGASQGPAAVSMRNGHGLLGNEEEETKPHTRMSLAERTLDALQREIEGDDYVLETTRLRDDVSPVNGAVGTWRDPRESNAHAGTLPPEVRPPNVPPNVMMRGPGAPRPRPKGKTPRPMHAPPPRTPRASAQHRAQPVPPRRSPTSPPGMPPGPPLRYPPAPPPLPPRRTLPPSPVLPPRSPSGPMPRLGPPPRSPSGPMPRLEPPPRSPSGPMPRLEPPPRSSSGPMPRLEPPPRSSSGPMPRLEPPPPAASPTRSRSALMRAVAEPGNAPGRRTSGSSPVLSGHLAPPARSDPAGASGLHRSTRSSMMSLSQGGSSPAAPEPQFVVERGARSGARVPPPLPRMPPDPAKPGPGPRPSGASRPPLPATSALETGQVVVGGTRKPVFSEAISPDRKSSEAGRAAPRSAGPPIMLLVLIGLGLAGGGYYGYLRFFPKRGATLAPEAPATAKLSSDAGPAKAAVPPPARAQAAVPPPAPTRAPAAAAPSPATSSQPVLPDPVNELIIASEPPHARVYLDGALIGRTPLTLEANTDSHKLAIIQPGYKMHIAEIDGRGSLSVALEEVTPSNGPAGIKIRCRQKNRYYVILDGAPTGQLCPTERLGVELGDHTAEIYDPVTDTRRVYKVHVEQTRRSVRVRVD